MLQINIAHSKKQLQHYESDWKPQELGNKSVQQHSSTQTTTSLHNRGFTPMVYRHPTPQEFERDALNTYNPSTHKLSKQKYIYRRQSLKFGYRKKEYVVGMTNIGYIDIDDITQTSDTLQLPTLENLSKALEGYYYYIHPSASRKPNKFRVMYRRNLTIYSTNHFNTQTKEWELDNPQLGQIKAVTDNNTPIPVNQDLQLLIPAILRKELDQFRKLLELQNINTSGLDETALQTHMHSKHLTDTSDKIAQSSNADGKELLQWI